MKSFFAVQSKFKIAFVLLVMVTIILGAALLERKFFTDVHISSASIYNDRLIPATALFHIGDNCYQKKLIIEDLFDTSSPLSDDSKKEIQHYSDANDSIILAFENTYLTEKEDKTLQRLKANIIEYNSLEQNILSSWPIHQSQNLYKLENSFEKIRAELRNLSIIQTQVGSNLLKESKNKVNRAHLITNFQIGAALFICIICQILILTSKSIQSPIKQRHNLN
ncbi:MCP four helix bundle domain-containing protein [Owenweeksia hongkongensis]|uniref:MCP four helix bundle domain-containing protein n=1 Tax=Owenweeksia hongkongensis TaxID=253245 RepID=UPI003A906631